jgi:hypothetical protein
MEPGSMRVPDLGLEARNRGIALVGPMFRHFGQDPTPAEIMRSRAPGVHEWVGRMWNSRATGTAPEPLSRVDAPLGALLLEACETHLVQLRENAIAYGR